MPLIKLKPIQNLLSSILKNQTLSEHLFKVTILTFMAVISDKVILRNHLIGIHILRNLIHAGQKI